MRPSIAMTFSALALMSAVPAAAQQRGARCNISAYVIDTDPRGLNVRAAPSTRARILRRVSADYPPRVEIRGQSGDWFRVTRVTNAEDFSVLFRGEGWVHVSMLGFGVANYDPRLYAAPSRQSRTLVRLVPDESRVDLIGCAGDWARVRAGRRIGWMSRGGICSNPLTTCP